MYQNLIKKYYTERNRYEEIYQEYFNNPATVKFDFNIKEWKAFLMFCPDLTNVLFEIMELNAKLNLLTGKLPSLALIQYAYSKLIDEIRLTNEIEGVHSTRKEISEILVAKQKKDKTPKFYNLVKKYEKLMQHTKISLNTCEDVRKLYDEIVLPEVLEEDKTNMPDGIYFRTNPVYLYDEKMNQIHEGLYPEEKIIDAMTKSLSILNDKSLNKLIAVAIFHYMIGYIHPFYDGNGRLNRFISSYLLSAPLNYLVAYAISGTIKQNKESYGKMFEQTNNEKNRGDLTTFVICFLMLIKNSLLHLIERLTEKCEKLDFFGEKLHSLFAGDEKHFQTLYVLLQNSLFGFDGMGADDLATSCTESLSVIRRVLKANDNLLRKEKSGHKMLYDIDLDKLSV